MELDVLSQGGFVLWIIILAGLFALGVFIERGIHLHRARIKTDDFLKGIVNILAKNNVQEALTICDETPGPVAFIVKTAILHRDDQKEAVRKSVDEASLGEISRMERRLSVVATVAQIAPLLGLLGTVIGMVQFLMVMHEELPLVTSADVLGGLFAAMITTAAGLMVAIPCYVAFNLLVIKIDRIVLDMEKAAGEIVAFVKDIGKA